MASEKRRPSSSLVSPLIVTLMVILGAYWKRCQQDAINESLSVPTYLVNVRLGT